MCTYHESKLKQAMRHAKIPRKHWDKLATGFEPFSETGIAPTMPLPIFTGDREVVTSSWGFRRSFARKDGKGKTAAKPVVNAQSEKMDSFMWRDAYRGRRCVVPVTAFYEWTWRGKEMTTHRFHQDGRPFLIAGIWEDGPEFGICHTLLTTLPNAEVSATGHDRCIVALLDHEVDPWLEGCDFQTPDFLRPDGLFRVESGVPNPRERKARPQGELPLE